MHFFVGGPIRVYGSHSQIHSHACPLRHLCVHGISSSWRDALLRQIAYHLHAFQIPTRLELSKKSSNQACSYVYRCPTALLRRSLGRQDQ